MEREGKEGRGKGRREGEGGKKDGGRARGKGKEGKEEETDKQFPYKNNRVSVQKYINVRKLSPYTLFHIITIHSQNSHSYLIHKQML